MKATLDFGGAAVVVTGGTRGIGKAIGLGFARAGATVYLTHRWGSADEAALLAEFAAAGACAPRIVESDVSRADETAALMRRVGLEAGAPLAVVSNVSFSQVVRTFDDLRQRDMERSIGYSAWPLVDLLRASEAEAGAMPRYAIAISSDGPDVCYPGYELAGASKAVLETLCRYLAVRLGPQGVRVNALRPGLVDTESARATFGHDLIDAAFARLPHVPVEALADACLALCSGLLDGVNGQVITVDGGASLMSPLSLLYQAGADLG